MINHQNKNDVPVLPNVTLMFCEFTEKPYLLIFVRLLLNCHSNAF